MGFANRALPWNFSQRSLFWGHFVLMPPDKTHIVRRWLIVV
jgi:hypothetical protein